MVYGGCGVSYTELSQMDLYAFTEAEQARLLWQGEWNKKPEA